MITEHDRFTGTGGLGEVCVRVDEVVGVGVLCEEREHAGGALGTGGHVVAFERGVGAQCMTAWKSKSMTAWSAVASPALTIFSSKAARKPRWLLWLLR